MAVRLRLAALGHTMERGKVVEWYVSEGGDVVEGAPLFAVETDKAVVDVEAPAGGVLLRIDAPVDKEYPVGATLAWIGDAGESLPERTDETVAAPEAVSGEQRVTPVARRLAERHGVDADRIEGTGPGGRVTKEDVRRAIDAGTAPALGETAAGKASGGSAPAGEVPGEPPHDVIPLTGIRRVTAERLSAHWTGAPQVTEGVDIDMTEVRALRTANRDTWRSKFGVMPALNDIVLKAVAVALEAHPALNSAFVDGAIHRYREINLGVAVDVEDGLVVPVLRNAGQLDLGGIASGVAELTARATGRQAHSGRPAGGNLHGQQPERAGRGLVHPGTESPAVRLAGRGQDAAHSGRGRARGSDSGHRHLRADLRPPGAGRGAGGEVPGEAQAAAGVSRRLTASLTGAYLPHTMNPDNGGNSNTVGSDTGASRSFSSCSPILVWASHLHGTRFCCMPWLFSGTERQEAGSTPSQAGRDSTTVGHHFLGCLNGSAWRLWSASFFSTSSLSSATDHSSGGVKPKFPTHAPASS